MPTRRATTSDTAQFYGPCNELIREALHPYASDLVVVSKVGPERDDHGGLVAAQRPEQLRQSVEANLGALGVERLAVVNRRRLDVRLPAATMAALDGLAQR